jgi:phosphoglucosamine mutase
MLEAALAAGIASAGGQVLLAGVLPTPAAPLLVRRYAFELAVVLSASHNPYGDNGIKLFGPDGFKLSDDAEQQIEQQVIDAPAAAASRVGRIRQLRGATDDYLRELHTRFADLALGGMHVVLDCANGATYLAAPEIFRRLGATVTVLAGEPDGRNINAGCGSTHIDALAERMRGDGADVGFAFDGDGDRVLAVDRNGRVVDGDELLAISALHLQRQGRLAGGGVAVTVMTNYGFHAAMRDAGIDVATTPVGDRYVLEALRARGWQLGGEQSGHIIELGFCPSGDGIASALLTLEALGGEPLDERVPFARLPQRLVSVPVRDRAALESSAILRGKIEGEAAALEGRGRVLVRASGTEPLVRVMVEAPTEDEADAVCGRLAESVRAELA